MATGPGHTAYVNSGPAAPFTAHGSPFTVSRPEDGRAHAHVLTQTPAILVYLAAKAENLPPAADPAGAKCLERLIFQAMDVSGPMAQRACLARRYAVKHAAAMVELTERALSFYRLLDHRLGESRFLAGDSYSIADIMAYPAARGFEHDKFAALYHIHRWLTEVESRDRVVRSLARLTALHAARESGTRRDVLST
jgi:GST-like protein